MHSSRAHTAFDSEGELIRMTETGQVRWRRPYGRSLEVEERQFARSFIGTHLRAVEVDGRPLLIAAASHAPHYPAEAALIDPLTGEPLDTCDARGPLVDRGQPGQLRRVSGQQGDYDEAAMLEAHRITQATFGDEHDVTVAAVEALAQVRTVG